MGSQRSRATISAVSQQAIPHARNHLGTPESPGKKSKKKKRRPYGRLSSRKLKIRTYRHASVQRRSSRITQSDQLPWRILRHSQRSLRIWIHNRQHFPTANSTDGQTLTLHRDHPVLFVKNFPFDGLHIQVGCRIPPPRLALSRVP